jgi:hypothetical protein
MAETKFTKEQWADPEYRARMKERDAKTKQMRKDDPWAIKSWGVPQNKKGKKTPAERKAAKAKAIKQWRAAHKLADKYLDYMKRTDQAPSDMDVTVVDKPGVIPHTEMVVPDSDEEKAVLALRELFLLAIGPTAIPEKIKAANAVLAYTKPKPESSTKVRVEKAEDFLDLIAEVRAPNDDDAEAD